MSLERSDCPGQRVRLGEDLLGGLPRRIQPSELAKPPWEPPSEKPPLFVYK